MITIQNIYINYKLTISLMIQIRPVMNYMLEQNVLKIASKTKIFKCNLSSKRFYNLKL